MNRTICKSSWRIAVIGLTLVITLSGCASTTYREPAQDVFVSPYGKRWKAVHPPVPEHRFARADLDCIKKVHDMQAREHGKRANARTALTYMATLLLTGGVGLVGAVLADDLRISLMGRKMRMDCMRQQGFHLDGS